MNKPLSIARREFTESLEKLIAESGLPYSMLSDIFKDAAIQTQQLENEQYERDMKAYQDFLKTEGPTKPVEGE